MRNQVIPGGRIVLIVTIKFSPVKIELNPRMNAPHRGENHRSVVVCCTGCRTSNRYPSPAGQERAMKKIAPATHR